MKKHSQTFCFFTNGVLSRELSFIRSALNWSISVISKKIQTIFQIYIFLFEKHSFIAFNILYKLFKIVVMMKSYFFGSSKSVCCIVAVVFDKVFHFLFHKKIKKTVYYA
nr:MAG TPA: hypothetical protein [Caudoviricetes sp.]